MVFDQTTFSIDLIGRYVCNTWDEAINSKVRGGSTPGMSIPVQSPERA